MGDGTWQRLLRERLPDARGKDSSSANGIPLEEFLWGGVAWDAWFTVVGGTGVESRRRLRDAALGDGGSGMARKSKQSSTLNSDKKCIFRTEALVGSWEAGIFDGGFSETDWARCSFVVSGRVLEESTIGIGDDLGTRGGLVFTRGSSSCILIVAPPLL